MRKSELLAISLMALALCVLSGIIYVSLPPAGGLAERATHADAASTPYLRL